MTQGFKEWLKKNKRWADSTLVKNYTGEGIPVIYLRALGDIALEKLIKFVKEQPSFKKNQLNHWYYAGKAEAYEEIAVACLGEKTIKRRLKEVGK